MIKEIRRTQNYLGRKYFLRYLLNSYNRIDEVYAARIGKNLYQCLCKSGCYDLCIDEKELFKHKKTLIKNSVKHFSKEIKELKKDISYLIKQTHYK